MLSHRGLRHALASDVLGTKAAGGGGGMQPRGRGGPRVRRGSVGDSVSIWGCLPISGWATRIPGPSCLSVTVSASQSLSSSLASSSHHQALGLQGPISCLGKG